MVKMLKCLDVLGTETIGYKYIHPYLMSSTPFGCAASFICISLYKGGGMMKSKYEQYLEMEKWYKRQERKTFLKYCIINLFKK